MVTSILPRWLLATLLIAVLTACSSATISPVPAFTDSPTSLPTEPTATQPAAPVTGGIVASSLTGRIVFDNTHDIYVMNADGTGVTQLTTDPVDEYDATFSPDGKQIAFRHQMGDESDIYLINADGSGVTSLTEEGIIDYAPAWSPDGATIAWNSDRDNPQSGILHGFLMNPDGSNVRMITDEIYMEYPAWSPDGSQIAFMSPVPFGSSNYEIFVINVDGSVLTRLTDSPGSDAWPAWSADGKQIVFTTIRDDCGVSDRPDCGKSGDIGPFHDLWIMNADGSGQTRLTQIFGQFSEWSPDGQYIVFNSFGGLFIIKPDGTDVTHLPTGSVGGELLFADWIP